MKKTLALVLALAMVFSTITVAFAEGTIGADAQICSDLGMLKGSTGTVDAAYTATAPTRIQAAVMVLRLRGLEADALAFTGTANFADADKAAWAKPIMAYLKANPQLGWSGDGTNFNPTGATTAQDYYKVMLEALGYKQNTTEVVGDFAYADVFTFAASKGLTKVAAVTNFTVNDLATATVETLKANMKDGGKTLVASLVEAGKVDKAKAVAAALYVDAATTEANLDAVLATGNDKVEVTFDADAAKAFAENVANYKVVVKGSTTALEVKAATAVSGTVVELTTAAQTGGAAYTMTVGSVSKNFAGLAKITGAPEVDTVKCIDTNTVEVVFKKAMDRASVEDVANYTLDLGATVKAAELWIDQDDTRKTVKLTTEGLAKNKVYKLTTANVKSADQIALKTVTKSFAGITDTVAPKIKGNVIVMNNQRFVVVFDDAHGVDKAAIENIANWTVDGLTITSIVAKDYIDYSGNTYGLKDDYSYIDAVEVNTEPMTSSTKYTITINNLVDGSTAMNPVAKALTKTFYGVAVDKSAPTAGEVKPVGDNRVEIQYNDKNRLDVVSATDISNYTFNEGLQVLSAEILRTSDLDNPLGKIVILNTSTMDKDTTYKITIENVADEFGNVISKVSNRSLRRTAGPDIAPPSVERVVWTDKNSVSVYFDDDARLDADTANDPANYVIDGDIGTVKKAELSSKSGYLRVDLTTPDLTANKSYKLTINGVKDRLGNEISNLKVSFVASMATADTDRPEVDNIVTLSKDEIRVTFDEPVVAAAGTTMTYHLKSAPGTPLTATVTGIAAPKYTIDDNTTMIFDTAAALTSNDEYVVDSISNVKDKHNNGFVVVAGDEPTFYGNTDNNELPEVIAIDQLSIRKFAVTFSEPVMFAGRLGTGTINTKTADVDVDDDQTTEALSVVTIDWAANIPEDTEITFNFGGVLDYVTGACAETAYKYTPYLVDEDKPVIEYVEAVSTAKVQIHFNEDLNAAGSYTIKGYFGSSTTETTVSVTGAVDGSTESIVNLDVTGLNMNAGEVYTITPKTSAVDLASNSLDRSDVEFDFVASAVLVQQYIKGIAIVDSKTIEVSLTTNSDYNAVGNATLGRTSISVRKDATGAPEMIAVAGVNDTDKDVWVVTLKTPLQGDDVDYKVVTAGEVAGTYTISGVSSDGGIDVDANEVITFSGFNNTDFVVKVVYDGGTATVAYNAVAAGGEAVGFDASTELTGLGTAAGTATDYPYTVEVYRNGDSAVLYTKEFTR